MTDYKKKDDMPLHRTSMFRSRGTATFIAAVNDEGQYAMWRADRSLPPGWRQQSAALAEEDCLAFIDSAWRDIRPASVQGHGSAYSTNPGHRPQYVHLMFDRRANATPDSMALVCPTGGLSYFQLAQSANRIANHLREIGVGPETVVGVYLERGIDAIRCLLAVLKAGGAYLPRDPALPKARLAQMCDEVRPAVILANRAPFPEFASGQVLLTDELMSSEPDTPDGTAKAAEPRLRRENLAYVIYTSGSTGQPKAVAVSHGSPPRGPPGVSPLYGNSPRARASGDIPLLWNYRWRPGLAAGAAWLRHVRGADARHPGQRRDPGAA